MSHIDQPDRPRRGRSIKKFVGGTGAVAAVALIAAFGVNSAFTDSTSSDNNFFQSGYLAIDSDAEGALASAGSAVFEVENVNDGSTGAKCFTVENTGSIDYDALTVSRSAGDDSDTATNLGLGEDITFTVEAINGGVDTTGGDCTAFDADTPDRTVAIGGLAETPASDSVTELAALKESGEAGPGDKVSYKVSYVVDIDNADAQQEINDIDFTWAASQG